MFTLEATVRTTHGKGSARKARKAGQLPAIVYVGGKDALSVTVSPKEATRILRSPMRRNSLVQLQVKGADGADAGTRTVMFRDVQVHPVRRDAMHIDFIEVTEDQEVVARVPFTTSGRAKSVVAGGKYKRVRRDIRVKTAANNIPQTLDIDITELPYGSTFADAIPLPENVKLAEPERSTIIVIDAPRGRKTEEEG